MRTAGMILLSASLALSTSAVRGQAPLPGQGLPAGPSAQAGSGAWWSENVVHAPAPGAPAQGGQTALSAYRQLPISSQQVATRLEELRNLMPNVRAKDFQELIESYLDWVADMADGHWKLHQAFAKVEAMKMQADVEKQTTLKLGQLKRQAMLLKAEFLIRENRQPEALHPLVEIIVAEPRTETGESAYQLLKQIGFSEEASYHLPPSTVSQPSSSGNAEVAAPPKAAPLPQNVSPSRTASRAESKS